MEKRNFSHEEKKKEAFLRIANVLYSHWRVSDDREKELLACGGHSRLFDVLIPDSYITMGESIKGRGHREHVVPCALIRNHSYKMFNNGHLIEDVSKMIEENLIIVHITSEEQKYLDYELGYKDTMPDDWTFGQDPYLRLYRANIDLKKYA